MSEISKEFGVSVSTVNKWVKQFRENGKAIFESSNSNISSEKETDSLYKKIGELTVERDFLKKVLDV